MGWGQIVNIIDKLLPSRKAALVDRMRELEGQLSDALINRRDTEAAAIRVQLKDLRKKIGYAEGEV